MRFMSEQLKTLKGLMSIMTLHDAYRYVFRCYLRFRGPPAARAVGIAMPPHSFSPRP